MKKNKTTFDFYDLMSSITEENNDDGVPLEEHSPPDPAEPNIANTPQYSDTPSHRMKFGEKFNSFDEFLREKKFMNNSLDKCSL